MRIWTLHPRYLDRQGLVALWREGLLAQAVLRGQTKGYRHHPQLTRFREQKDPVAAMASYLASVHSEAVSRGYRFDAGKISNRGSCALMTETSGQINYEWQHLKKKLSLRSPSVLADIAMITEPIPHPLFRIVHGQVRSWEKMQEL